MGRLRDGILALQKNCVNMEPQIDELVGQQDIYHTRIFEAGKRVGEGLNTLVLYLMEKLKKAGKTFETEGDRPLKEEMDSNVMAFGKGIVSGKVEVKKVIADLAKAQSTSVENLHKSVEASYAQMEKLKAIAEKKKAKWLKSAKYKAKIGGYLAALGAVENILKKQSEVLGAINGVEQNDAWVERCYKFSQDMTLKQVRAVASTDLNTNLKDYEQSKGKIQTRARQFRDEYKSLGGQFAIFKKWVEEADGMEAESEEK